MMRNDCAACVQEALKLGGLLTLEDLANLFNCGVRILDERLDCLAQEQDRTAAALHDQDLGRTQGPRVKMHPLFDPI